MKIDVEVFDHWLIFTDDKDGKKFEVDGNMEDAGTFANLIANGLLAAEGYIEKSTAMLLAKLAFGTLKLHAQKHGRDGMNEEVTEFIDAIKAVTKEMGLTDNWPNLAGNSPRGNTKP